MFRSLILGLFVCCLVSFQPILAQDIKTRKFEFDYRVSVPAFPNQAAARVWIPIPQSTDDQKIELIGIKTAKSATISSEPKYGNRMLYVAGTGEDLVVELKYLVTRREVVTANQNEATALAKDQVELFLQPNKMVPVEGKSISLYEQFSEANPFSGDSDQASRGKHLYDFVGKHMAYDKSQPGYGNGDVAWACDSKTGNCTDFHSLFISVARHKQIPAKFEIGFPLPPERGEGSIGGYHCWAKFHVAEKGWVPVDISEADKDPSLEDYYYGNLTENRIQFTTGRDIDLVPQQASDPLNYFIYPHVEVAGQVLEKGKFEMSFGFKDLGDRDQN